MSNIPREYIERVNYKSYSRNKNYKAICIRIKQYVCRDHFCSRDSDMLRVFEDEIKIHA